jgi:hypothetical protein
MIIGVNGSLKSYIILVVAVVDVVVCKGGEQGSTYISYSSARCLFSSIEIQHFPEFRASSMAV